MSTLNFTEVVNTVEINEDYAARTLCAEQTATYHVYLQYLVISITRPGITGSFLSIRDLTGTERFKIPADEAGVVPIDFGEKGLWIDGGNTSTDTGPGCDIVAVSGSMGVQPYAWVYARSIVTTKQQDTRTFKLEQ